MRIPDLLAPTALLLLASCQSAAADGFQDLQRQRLLKLHGARSPEATLQRVIAEAPAARVPVATVMADTDSPPAPQAPQHLDQRLPSRPVGSRPMRESWQPLEASIDVGVGRVGVHASGSKLNDRADAQFLRARLEASTGAGLHVDLWQSDGDLFAGRFVNDGLLATRADAELTGVDIFPHVRFDSQLGRLDMPIRVGMFGDWQQLDHSSSPLARSWIGFGPRVVLEPTLRLVENDRIALDLFGRAGGDVGIGWFEDQYRNGQDHDTAARWSGELGAGVRARFGRVHSELGYRLIDTTIGPLDGSLYGSSHRTSLDREQFYIGFGVTY